MKYNELPKKYQELVLSTYLSSRPFCDGCDSHCEKLHKDCRQGIVDYIAEDWHDYVIVKDLHLGVTFKERDYLNDDDDIILE